VFYFKNRTVHLGPILIWPRVPVDECSLSKLHGHKHYSHEVMRVRQTYCWRHKLRASERASVLPQRIPLFLVLWPAERSILLSGARKLLFYHGHNRTALLYRHSSFRDLLRPCPRLADDRNYKQPTLSHQTLLFCKSIEVANSLCVSNESFA
jgi:hypothetical protein